MTAEVGSAVSAASRDVAATEALEIGYALAHTSGRIMSGMRGVVVHGSLTLGDYLPGRSDIDLLVVVDEPLNDTRLAGLATDVERVWRLRLSRSICVRS